MAQVNWDSARHVFEDMVSNLLSNLHPNAERIDGSGGDDGRDVQLRESGRLDLFELKSFTGRVSKEKGRRRNIEKSLKKAAELQPNSWTLVVPIDPTSGELTWFDGLKGKYPFPLTWRGRTWLDDQMGKHPSIVRYHLEGADGEAMRALRELGKEQAALDRGAPDAVERLHKLRDRMEEIDPYYRIDIHMTGDTTTIEVHPRNRNAVRDRPIVISGRFSFPDTSIGRETAEKVQAVFDFGEDAIISGEFTQELHIDAPAGLGGDLTGGHLQLGPAQDDTPFQLNARLIISSPEQRQLASLPLRFTQRRLGNIGGSVSGGDITGSLMVTIKFDASQHRADFVFTFAVASGLLPGVLLTVLRAAQHLHGPNSVQITFGELDMGGPQSLPDLEFVSDDMVELIADLDRVQAATGTPFVVPDELNRDDVDNIRDAARLLAGEHVEVKTSELTAKKMHVTDDEGLLAWLRNDEAMAIMMDIKGYAVKIAGVDVPLGDARFHAPAVRVTNRAELLVAYPWQEGEAIPVVFSPEPGSRLGIRLVRP